MKRKVSIAVAAFVSLVALMPGASPAKMSSVEVSKNVCQTTGGGRFVDIPGFPGEQIDRRLLKDIKFLRRKYEIFITDGFSRSGVHSINGEHPLGLGLDIVPNFAAGGDWNDIDRLANWAEPRQNAPRSPFRWVGYNGDAGHGRGHHLHLSYNHSAGQPYKPVDTMFSVKCPDSGGGGKGDQPDPKNNDGGGGGDKDQNGSGNGGNDGGGVSTGGNGGGGKDGANGGSGSDGGGVSPRSSAPIDPGPVQPETGGVGL